MTTPKTFRQFLALTNTKDYKQNIAQDVHDLLELSYQAGDGAGFERGYQAGMRKAKKPPRRKPQTLVLAQQKQTGTNRTKYPGKKVI